LIQSNRLELYLNSPVLPLPLLVRTSRTFRATARQQIAQRCGLARSVFETCAQELRKRAGSTRGPQNAYLRASFEGWRNGKLSVEMDLSMLIALKQDQIRITVDEARYVCGVILPECAPFRFDEFIVWPAENRMERDLNRHREPAIPVPEELADYLCATFMHPIAENTEGVEIVCVTDMVYGRVH
jgi:hypothetical protein